MADDEQPVRRVSPKWLREDGDPGARVKKSRKHETRIAKAFGGKRLPASGAKRYSRWTPTSVTAGGDVGTPSLHIEHKYVEPTTMSVGVKREWLEKVTAGAGRALKTPAMVLTFEKAVGFEQDWLLIPVSTARRLMGIEDIE
jgi:hypothetical protein